VISLTLAILSALEVVTTLRYTNRRLLYLLYRVALVLAEMVTVRDARASRDGDRV